jgi:hypothetical protein
MFVGPVSPDYRRILEVPVNVRAYIGAQQRQEASVAVIVEIRNAQRL